MATSDIKITVTRPRVLVFKNKAFATRRVDMLELNLCPDDKLTDTTGESVLLVKFAGASGFESIYAHGKKETRRLKRLFNIFNNGSKIKTKGGK